MRFLLIKGRFGPAITCNKYTKEYLRKKIQAKNYSGFNRHPKNYHLAKINSVPLTFTRNFIILRILQNALKIRYIILGTTVGGGVHLNRKYEEWKESLPDLGWLSSVLPSPESMSSFKKSILPSDDKLEALKNFYLDSKAKIYDANKDIIKDSLSGLEGKLKLMGDRLEAGSEATKDSNGATSPLLSYVKSESKSPFSFYNDESTKENMKLREEHSEYRNATQRQLSAKDKEILELRKQILILRGQSTYLKGMKKSLIDMYSEVLDELSGFDSGYNFQDHLPRVVVVGDQSAGKTSVLEMIAQARIFPRGAGQMMTRAPVKVTLSEGPYHIAKFPDSTREYDLSQESELSQLRKEVELRMRASIKNGKTVSNDVISMTVMGPGLKRMVLVDLPGVIVTNTLALADGTREAISEMTKFYMNNPNAIILCVQDGSIDAERSVVTDLVSKADPKGKRTIFVLTKVDLAESNLTDPTRIEKILSGQLFPMNALGYFAVVTGRGNKDDSIEDIKRYEDAFFQKSNLCQRGNLKYSQCTTQNLSLAVSDCFWGIVRESIVQQADAFKAEKYNLETEWKSTYPKLRPMDRNELFEKARGEILDEIVHLGQLNSQHWKDILHQSLWEKFSVHVFDNIFFPASQGKNQVNFNTTVGIKLKHWTENTLPKKSVEVAWEVLKGEIIRLMENTKKQKDHDNIFDKLKSTVINEALKQHAWEDKASEVLKVMQEHDLQDDVVHTKNQWDEAINFLESSLEKQLGDINNKLNTYTGPGFSQRWLSWKWKTEQENSNSCIKNEVENLIFSNSDKEVINLSKEDVITIKKNIQANYSIDVEPSKIREIWLVMNKKKMIERAKLKAIDCKKVFYHYSNDLDSDLDCSEVVLFSRLNSMLNSTSNALRQQIMKREASRLEKEIKMILDDLSADEGKKTELLEGKRVYLAEQFKKVSQIQEMLDEFIITLNEEDKKN